MIKVNKEAILDELDNLKLKVEDFEEQIEELKKYEDIFENFESNKFIPSSLESIKNIIEDLDNVGIECINQIMNVLKEATEILEEVDTNIGKGIKG